MRKYITVILAVLVIGGAFGIQRALKNRKKPAMKQRSKQTSLAYVKSVKNEDMPVIIPTSGSLVAKDKIKLYSEVQGILEQTGKEFKPGVYFKKGQVLYKLNSDEAYTNILSQRSSFQNLIVSMMPDLRLDYSESYEQWQKYLNEFDIHSDLQEFPVAATEKEKRFISSKTIYTNFYSIKNLEIKLRKYTIYAPYNGVLTEASVTPGSLVRPGQLMGEYVNPAVYEMEVSINNDLAMKLNVGDHVDVKDLENSSFVKKGKIIRINEKVDLSSQTVNIFIELKGESLKEGMYLKALLKSRSLKNVVEIPRSLLVNQHQLYVVNDSMLQLVDIDLIHQNAQNVVVRGLENNSLILMKPVPKAYQGMKVVPMPIESIGTDSKAITKAEGQKK